MKKQPLRVGFDLDGVILYNPARIIRPIVVLAKKFIFGGKPVGVEFYIPKSKWEKFIWWILHKSSLFVAPGMKDLKRLIREGKIEAYIITARYSFLQADLQGWLNKFDADRYFKKYFYNERDEQPHLYKERLIRQLNLDIFVEDNWDIVNHMKSKAKNQKSKVKMFWIYNLFDKKIDHPYKFHVLAAAVSAIRREIGEKKKVLIVTDYFYPHWTGISKSIFNMTQKMKSIFDFTVLTVRYKKTLSAREKVRDLDIIRSNYLFPISRAKYSISLIISFIKEVNRYDTVYINSPCSNILPIAILTRFFKKRLVIFHQGDLILPAGFFNRFIQLIFDVMTRSSMALAGGVATYTDDYAKHSRILKTFLYKFTPILMPVSMGGRVEGLPTRAQAPPSTGGKDRRGQDPSKLNKLSEQGKVIFGFAGRFVEEKGFDILLEAIPKIIKKLPNAHFVFAGETHMEYEKTFENLKSKISNLKSHLTLLGLLNDNELQQFYKAIDFIVIPSRSDCFNLVQAEAMICGVPSVVSDIPGARWLVKNTGFGVIFKSRDSQALTQAVIKAHKNRAVFLKNHRKVLEILDDPQNAEKLKKYLAG